MAFDIIVDNGHNNIEIIIHFFIDEYVFVISRIDKSNNYPILNIALKDYYGEYEICLNEVEPLKSEVIAFINQFESDCPDNIKIFMESFRLLIEHAMLFNRTVKFVGD